MRKIIVTLGLVLMCIMYFILIRKDIVEKDSNSKIDVLINKEKNELTQTYPSSPKDIVESHNRLMQYEYSKEIRDENIPLLLETMRMVYSEELLKANSLESQQTSLLIEIANNREKGLYMIGSQLGDILYSDEDKVTITVKHFTTLGDIVRNYNLIEENKKWKINHWENKLPD